jgi:hypothetical protein
MLRDFYKLPFHQFSPIKRGFQPVTKKGQRQDGQALVQ